MDLSMLDDFTNDSVAEGGSFSERELAILLAYPADPESLGDLQGVYEEARTRAQEILDLAVSTRVGKGCDYEGCSTPATFKITPDEGDPLQSCEVHLGQLMTGASEVAPIAG